MSELVLHQNSEQEADPVWHGSDASGVPAEAGGLQRWSQLGSDLRQELLLHMESLVMSDSSTQLLLGMPEIANNCLKCGPGPGGPNGTHNPTDKRPKVARPNAPGKLGTGHGELLSQTKELPPQPDPLLSDEPRASAEV